jgi:hypothetical protein
MRGYLEIDTSRGRQVMFADLYPWERGRLSGRFQHYPPYPRRRD